jgi:hypothetical protein
MKIISAIYQDLKEHYSSTEIFIKLFAALMGCLGAIMILLAIWKFLSNVLGESILT